MNLQSKLWAILDVDDVDICKFLFTSRVEAESFLNKHYSRMDALVVGPLTVVASGNSKLHVKELSNEG